MAAPIKELKSSRDDLIARFCRGEVEGSFQERYSETLDDYFRSVLEEMGALRMSLRERTPFAFVASGGYGRKEMSIHSDVDVMILFRSRIPAGALGLVESVFYPVWDIGLELGHGIRSIKDCVGLAKKDFEVLTSLLDGRFICGDPDLFFSLMQSLQEKAVSRNKRRLAQWLKESETARMAAHGDASGLLEPNLKEGIGGLRDYHQILWASKILFRLIVPRDLEHAGILSHREYVDLRESLDFIGLARNHLHRMSGRKNDRLTFGFQEKIAAALGFQKNGELLAVEQFLSRLHDSMASIKSLHRSFVRTHLPAGPHRNPDARPEKLTPSIDALHGEIGFNSAGAAASDPRIVLELFGWVARKGYPAALEAKRAARESLPKVDERFRGSEEATRAFLSMLDSPFAFEALQQMDEVGLLGGLIPEYGHVRGRVQFDSYHLYPVGTHLLQTVRNIKEIGREKNILLPAILSDIAKPRTLLLACLLHDVGKTGRSHARRGVAIAHRVLERFRCGADETEDILFLISHHLLLAETATRRDLNDEKVVVQCARTIGTIDRLKMLYLLTWADSRATGPRAWNDWTENLVTELFFKILHTLEQKELATPDASKRIRSNLARIRKARNAEVGAAGLDAILDAMSSRYLLETEPREMVRHVDIYRTIERSLATHPRTTFALEASRTPSGENWETLFMARDRPGLFSDVTGVLALNNINILSAHIYTWRDGTAVDRFMVGRLLDPLHPQQLWAKVREDLAKVFAGELPLSSRLEEKAKGGVHRPMRGSRPPEVIIDDGSSDFFTLVEVFADDRPGLLYRITHTLFELGLDIRIAKIATRGDQIADIFYVRDLDGQKLQERGKAEEVRETLTRRLGEPGRDRSS